MAKTAILARLGERTLPPALVGLEEQHRKVADLMRRSIEMGESNSCLILGPRGTGKTMIVRQALQDIEEQFRTKIQENQMEVDGDEEQKDFMVIQLNGLVQTDDRMALKEIMRQLSREGEEEMDGSNDALELLEKRVKSRFSHRQYYTFPPSSYHDYVEICENTLLLSAADLDIEMEDGMVVGGPEVEAKERFIKEFNHRVK
ncbi:origin recognition complex subunit 4, partial [Haplosporangium sp. Z 27]